MFCHITKQWALNETGTINTILHFNDKVIRWNMIRLLQDIPEDISHREVKCFQLRNNNTIILTHLDHIEIKQKESNYLKRGMEN